MGSFSLQAGTFAGSDRTHAEGERFVNYDPAERAAGLPDTISTRGRASNAFCWGCVMSQGRAPAGVLLCLKRGQLKSAALDGRGSNSEVGSMNHEAQIFKGDRLLKTRSYTWAGGDVACLNDFARSVFSVFRSDPNAKEWPDLVVLVDGSGQEIARRTFLEQENEDFRTRQKGYDAV